MSISFDITTDVRFKQGLEQGIEQGLEEGKAILSIIAIRNLLREQIVTDSKTIALILDTSINFVETTKGELKKEAKLTKALNVKGARINSLVKKYEVSKTFVKALRKVLKKKGK